MKRLSEPQGKPVTTVTIDVEGQQLTAREGEPIAVAMLAAGETVFSRSIKYHRPRGPYCLSAACTHCLMRVDGVPNIYTCRTPVKSGMRIERQNAYPSAKVDVFQSIDWLFPKGLDHHAMFAGVPVAEQVMAKVARHLAGLGLLPDKPAPERVTAETIHTRVAIAGGGAAGTAAAAALTDGGVEFLLLERDGAVGGRLLNGPPEDGVPSPKPIAARNLKLRCAVIGLYDDKDGRYFAAIQYGPEGARLLKIYAERFLCCTGGHPPIYPFENNDLPGVFAGRAATALIRKHGLLPGEEFVLVGTGPELSSTAKLVEAHGGTVKAVLDVRAAPTEPAIIQVASLRAHGRQKVSGVSYKPVGKGARAKKLDCDAILVCMPPSPSFELARQGGARVNFSDAHQVFVVEADADGRTHAKEVFVAGELTGPTSAKAAAESGQQAGAAIARELGGRP